MPRIAFAVALALVLALGGRLDAEFHCSKDGSYSFEAPAGWTALTPAELDDLNARLRTGNPALPTAIAAWRPEGSGDALPIIMLQTSPISGRKPEFAELARDAAARLKASAAGANVETLVIDENRQSITLVTTSSNPDGVAMKERRALFFTDDTVVALSCTATVEGDAAAASVFRSLTDSFRIQGGSAYRPTPPKSFDWATVIIGAFFSLVAAILGGIGSLAPRKKA